MSTLSSGRRCAGRAPVVVLTFAASTNPKEP